MSFRIQEISSSQNTKVKEAAKLRDSKTRKKTGTFLVEGAREVARAFKAGFAAQTIFFKDGMSKNESDLVDEISTMFGIKTVFSVSDDVYSKLAVRESTESLTVIFELKKTEVSSLELPQKPVICVLDGVEKPGNQELS